MANKHRSGEQGNQERKQQEIQTKQDLPTVATEIGASDSVANSVGTEGQSKAKQVKDGEGNKTYNNQQEPNIPRWLLILNILVTLLFTAVIAGATVCQVFVAKWQWDSMNTQNTMFNTQNTSIADQTNLAKGQLDLTKKTSEQTQKMLALAQLDQRAWLSVPRPELVDDTRSSFRCVLPIANTGKTPGSIKQLWMKMFTEPNPQKIGGKVNSIRSQKPEDLDEVVIAPNATIEIEVPNKLVERDGIGSGVNSGSRSVYVYAFFTYEDGISDPNKLASTECCFKYDADQVKCLALPQYSKMK